MGKVSPLEEIKLKMIEDEKKVLVDMLELIDSSTSDVRPRINVNEFETFFMPYIIGLYERNKDNSVIYLHNYLKITEGNPNLEIVVIGNNNEELYIIPPIMVSDVILGTDSIDGLADAISYFLKANENGPLAQAEASNVLTNTINKLKESLSINEELALKHLKDYTKIYNDYKHLLNDKNKRIEQVLNNNTIKESHNEDVDDLFDY